MPCSGCSALYEVSPNQKKRYRATSGETNFIERIKAPIFFEAVLAIDIIKVHQSNLEEKVSPSILKDDFSLKTDPSIFTSIPKMNKPLPIPVLHFS